MIDPRLGWFAIGALFGAVLFGWPWHPRFSRFRRRSVIFCATKDDAFKVSSQIINPLPGHQPNPMTVKEWAQQYPDRRFVEGLMAARAARSGIDVQPFDEGRIQRGNGSGGPTIPKPIIIPHGQERSND